MSEKTSFLFNMGFAIVVLTQVAICIGFGYYWYFIDTKPPRTDSFLEVVDLHGNLTKRFMPGETMVILRDSCTTRDGMVFYTRQLVSKDKNITYTMPSSELFLQTGCRRAINYVEVPQYVQPGLYRYRVTIRYKNNPIYEGTTELPPFEIEVVPPKPELPRKKKSR